MSLPSPASPVRPRVVVSRCLGFAAVRYDGRVLESHFVAALQDHVRFVQVCPEVRIGLGVPRDPIRVEREGSGAVRLVQPSTGRDLTRTMSEFATAYLDGLGTVDGFILKARSPSCAFRDAKIHGAESESRPGRGPGLFAAAVTEAFPWAAQEDEERLTNVGLRHHFLTHLWALARLRRVESSGRRAELVRHHAAHRLLLATRGPEVPARLGRIAADPEDRPLAERIDAYRRAMGEALRNPPGTRDAARALRYAFGLVSDRLDSAERARFLERLDAFREGRLTLPEILAVLRSRADSLEEAYRESRFFFEPYPGGLLELAGPGDG